MTGPGPLAVVGPGRVGRTLAGALSARGWSITGLVGRSDSTDPIERAGVVVMAVPDDLIAPAFENLVSRGVLREDQILLHCSGLVSSAVFARTRLDPAGRASLHPMMAFAGDLERALEALPGTTFGVEGDAAGVDVATRIVETLEGALLTVPEDAKPAYHLACVMASNGLVALTDMAERIARAGGVEGEGVAAGLSNLVTGTAGNMARLGIRPAMTGPVVRGDTRTVGKHLDVLAGAEPAVREAYVVLMRRLVEMSVEAGHGEASAYEEILGLLE